MKVYSKTLLALAWAALLLAAPWSLLAQTMPPDGDPFAKVHANLLRAAETRLVQLRTAPPSGNEEPVPDRAVTAAAAVDSASGDAAKWSNVSLERVRRAQNRLQSLGVDAARIFVEEGVPLELLTVAEVESGFQPFALSPKGARGLWQLMPATAARFGLRVDTIEDERVNPRRSTRAAARYLRALHGIFGDWQLALAAYNAGEGRVMQAVARGSSRDFFQLAGLGLLPRETRRYVPAVLAVRVRQD